MIGVGRWWLFSTPMPQLRPRCHSIYRFLPVPARDSCVCCLVCLCQLHPGGIRGRKAAKSALATASINARACRGPGCSRQPSNAETAAAADPARFLPPRFETLGKKTKRGDGPKGKGATSQRRFSRYEARDAQPSPPAAGRPSASPGLGERVPPPPERRPGVVTGSPSHPRHREEVWQQRGKHEKR